MSPRNWKLRLTDMLKAIQEIQSFTLGLDKGKFLKDRLRYHAVVRCLEIIGEASTHVPREIKEKYPEVAWQEIRNFRVILAHKYFVVDDEIVWNAVEFDLEPLRQSLDKIVKAEIT